MTAVPSDKRAEPGLLTGIALLVPITLAVMGIVLLAPVLPQLQAAFKSAPHADYLVPMVLTTPAACVALFSPFAGALGDRFGRRRLLILSLIVYAGFGVAPVFLNDLWAILLSRVGVGVTESLIMTLSTALIGDAYSGVARDRWLGYQTGVASLSALGLLVVGGYLGGYGWRGPFAFYASSLIMLALVLLFTREFPPRAEDEAALEGGQVPFPWARMAGVCAVTVFGSVLFYTVQIQASVGLSLHGITDPRRIGFLTMIASLGVPIGTFVFRFISRTPVALLLSVEFAALAAGFVAMTLATDAGSFLLAAGVNQLGAGLLLPTLLTWAMRGLPYAIRGRGTGMWQSAFAAGQFVCPIVVTAISKAVGGLLPSFQYLGYAAIVAGLLAALSVARGRRSAPAI